MLEAQIPEPPAEPPPEPIPGVPPIRPPEKPPKPPIEEPPPPAHAPHQKHAHAQVGGQGSQTGLRGNASARPNRARGSMRGGDAQVGQLWSIACLAAPRCYMVAASAFHLVNPPADAKGAGGPYEMEVVKAQETE